MRACARASMWLSDLERRNIKSEDPGFDPLAWQGERQFFFLSFRVNSCADLFMPTPYPQPPPPPQPHLINPSCVRYAPTFVRTLKIPYPSVVKLKEYAS